MRPIDADELVIDIGTTFTLVKNNEYQKGFYDGLIEAQRLTEDAPTVDTERHGHWIYKQLDNYKKYSVTCSVCGAEYIDNYDGYITAENFNGCPNCLAKMDEVTE